ncbi:MAG: outer membrane beta-barrel protein [Pseudomonadota bacterium]
MKRFTSALLAVTALATVSVYADGAVSGGSESKTGIYVGGNAGLANTNVKYGFTNAGTNFTATGAGPTSGAVTSQYTMANNSQAGSFGGLFGLFGLFAGYGMQVGTMYFGGEAFGGLDTAKVTSFDDNGTGNGSVTSTGVGTSPVYAIAKASVKRTSYYGLAARIGAFVNSNTLFYVRLGVEAGKWQAQVQPHGVFTANDGGVSNRLFTANKNSISFAPGLGLEAYITHNMFVRAEYTYLFGPKLNVSQNTVNAEDVPTDAIKHTFKVSQQTFKVGVGYKF